MKPGILGGATPSARSGQRPAPRIVDGYKSMSPTLPIPGGAASLSAGTRSHPDPPRTRPPVPEITFPESIYRGRLISHPWAYSSLRHLGPQTEFYQLSFVDCTAGNDHAPLNRSRDFTPIRNVVSSLSNSSEDGIGVDLPERTLVAKNIGLSRAFDCIC